MSKREGTSQLLGDVMFRDLTGDLTGQDLTPDRVLEAGPKRGEREGKNTYTVLRDLLGG